MDMRWRPIDSHPDTGDHFGKKSIQSLNRMVDACVELHTSIPQFMIIGWDAIIDSDDTVVLFEWNTEWPSIKRDEAMSGPILDGIGLEHMRHVPD
jgi:hypothetical protein